MTIGAQLQQARNSRKLTYAEVTEKTKIQPWVLEAIETNRLPEIMSLVYVKGFISSYAKFLHVDPEPLLAELTAPKPEPVVAAPLPPAQPALPPVAIAWPIIQLPTVRLPRVRMPRVEIPEISSTVWRRAGVAVLATAVVVGLVIAKPKIAMPKFQLALPKISLPKFAKAESKGKADAQAAKPKKAAAATKKAAKPAVTAAAPKEPVRVEVLAPVIQAASVAPVAESLTSQAPPALTLVPTQAMELNVTATKTTWIKVWADGKLLTQQRLPRGAKEKWTAKKQFQLIIAKPSQVDVTLNGQSISPFTIAHQGRVLITHNGVARLPESE